MSHGSKEKERFLRKRKSRERDGDCGEVGPGTAPTTSRRSSTGSSMNNGQRNKAKARTNTAMVRGGDYNPNNSHDRKKEDCCWRLQSHHG